MVTKHEAFFKTVTTVEISENTAKQYSSTDPNCKEFFNKKLLHQLITGSTIWHMHFIIYLQIKGTGSIHLTFAGTEVIDNSTKTNS